MSRESVPTEPVAAAPRDSYAALRVSPLDPATLRCEDVERTLEQLAARSSGALQVGQFAESYEGRPIFLASIGIGPRRVLMWSQMHGDEPTHTAVLLDLLSYLVTSPTDTAAAEILRDTTLHLLPMLNPDGAAAVTRYNAQHIDINRDSQRLQTPEGRALRAAVDTLRPEFGFNLHNQNARTALGNPPRPAAVALMAPPIDARDTETAQIRAAKQIAACFAAGVLPAAAGMVARYVAEYMPWAFGEDIQSRGVVTVLVEAGGWPGRDPTPLVEVHFNGLVAALRSIATGAYQQADPQAFERLPRDNELKLYDVTIVGGQVYDGDFLQPLRADLGVNHSHGHRLALGRQPDARIVDLGDLGTATGKVVIDAAGGMILPGRIALIDDWHPGLPLAAERLAALLAAGVTTVLGRLAASERAASVSGAASYQLPINWGFVAADAPPVANRAAPQTLAEWVAADESQHFGLDASRGKVRRDYAADLVVRQGTSDGTLGALREVIVAGESVWRDGQLTGTNAGALLRTHQEQGAC